MLVYDATATQRINLTDTTAKYDIFSLFQYQINLPVHCVCPFTCQRSLDKDKENSTSGKWLFVFVQI